MEGGTQQYICYGTIFICPATYTWSITARVFMTGDLSLGVYMVAMMLIGAITIALQVLVLSMHHHPPNKHPPNWIWKLLKTLKWNRNLYSAVKDHHIHNSNQIEPMQSISKITTKNNNKVGPGIHQENDKSPGSKEKAEMIQNEWKNLAADLDSLSFWICFGALVSCSFIVLGIMPLTSPDPSMDITI